MIDCAQLAASRQRSIWMRTIVTSRSILDNRYCNIPPRADHSLYLYSNNCAKYQGIMCNCRDSRKNYLIKRLAKLWPPIEKPTFLIQKLSMVMGRLHSRCNQVHQREVSSSRFFLKTVVQKFNHTHDVVRSFGILDERTCAFEKILGSLLILFKTLRSEPDPNANKGNRDKKDRCDQCSCIHGPLTSVWRGDDLRRFFSISTFNRWRCAEISAVVRRYSFTKVDVALIVSGNLYIAIAARNNAPPLQNVAPELFAHPTIALKSILDRSPRAGINFVNDSLFVVGEGIYATVTVGLSSSNLPLGNLGGSSRCVHCKTTSWTKGMGA